MVIRPFFIIFTESLRFEQREFIISIKFYEALRKIKV